MGPTPILHFNGSPKDTRARTHTHRRRNWLRWEPSQGAPLVAVATGDRVFIYLFILFSGSTYSHPVCYPLLFVHSLALLKSSPPTRHPAGWHMQMRWPSTLIKTKGVAHIAVPIREMEIHPLRNSEFKCVYPTPKKQKKMMIKCWYFSEGLTTEKEFNSTFAFDS